MQLALLCATGNWQLATRNQLATDVLVNHKITPTLTSKIWKKKWKMEKRSQNPASVSRALQRKFIFRPFARNTSIVLFNDHPRFPRSVLPLFPPATPRPTTCPKHAQSQDYNNYKSADSDPFVHTFPTHTALSVTVPFTTATLTANFTQGFTTRRLVTAMSESN